MTGNNDTHPELVEAGPATDDESARKPETPQTPEQAEKEPLEAATEALALAQAEAEDNLNKYMRLAAEMENLRKRTARDVEHAHKYAIERFATDLLAVTDSLEMGLQAADSASVASLLEGTRATLKLLHGALAASGVEVVDPEGEPFDPQLHEAMTMQASPTAEPGSVLTVVQKGYALNGRLLRPARVIVAAEPPADE
ncbi:MAG: nucleotide exchange factor GrpE [Gammaproteobacteria bacterium]